MLSVSKNKNYQQDFTYYFKNNLGEINLNKVDIIKDLGVIIDPELKFDNHIHEKVNKAFQMVGVIRRSFCN